MNINPLHPPIPREYDNVITWDGLSGAGCSLSVANLSQADHAPIIIISPDAHTAEKYFHELKFFLQGSHTPVYFFPDRETLPYDHFSPHEDLTSERLSILSRLPTLKSGVIVTTVSTLMHRLPPKTFLSAHQFLWKTGTTLDLTNTRKELIEAGYRLVEQVIQHGEFAIRGAIIDVFPMGSHTPFRVELFDNEIDSIRTFDIDSQKSIEKTDSINLLPAHEYPLTEESITHFRQQWRMKFTGNPAESPVYQHVSKSQPIGGIEYYLSLFFESLATFFNYCPSNARFILTPDLIKKADHFWNEVQIRFEQNNVDSTRPLCPPTDIFIPVNDWFMVNHYWYLPIKK